MGVPHLMHHLQAYGQKIILERPTGQQDQQLPTARNVIIDGPALAYHLYSVCQSRRGAARNALDAIPSYHELGHAVVPWLEQLEQFGVRIQVIYFDGLLPNSKKEVRSSRLQNYANQLVNFKAFHRDDLPPRTADVHFRARDLFPTATPARSKSLSAPPFLVNAVIEALLVSKYASLASVVAGEADAYCAEAARHNEATILTSDSDLVVHDLGNAGKVILFRDIESVHLASKGRCIKVTEYHPKGIAERLGLQDLVELAYFMNEDHHRSFTETCRLAKSQQPTNPDWLAFKELYGALPIHSAFATLILEQSDSPLVQVFSKLDPRISELIHELKPPSLGTSQNDGSQSRTLDMYLPFMIDDPTKTSAWRAGEEIRQIGYTVLQSIDPTVAMVQEYERKGTRIAETAVRISTSDEVAAAAQALGSKIETCLQNSGVLSSEALWRHVAMILLLEWSIRNGKPLPTQHETTSLVLSPRTAPLTWRAIHASAQMHSILYSLRMVKQLIGVTHALDPTSLKSVGVESLRVTLEQLPGLAAMLEGGAESDASDEAKAFLNESVAGFYSRSDGGSDDGRKRKKRRKNQKDGADVEKKTPSGSASKWASGNVFAALG